MYLRNFDSFPSLSFVKLNIKREQRLTPTNVVRLVDSDRSGLSAPLLVQLRILSLNRIFTVVTPMYSLSIPPSPQIQEFIALDCSRAGHMVHWCNADDESSSKPYLC